MTSALRTWIREPLVSYHPLRGAVVDGGIVTQNGMIVESVAWGESPSGPVDEIFDARSLVLLPGLINTHHHFYQTLTRALRSALDKPLFPWLESLYPVWAHLSIEMIDAATRLACAELLLSGCTTTTDHHYVFSDATREGIDTQMRAAGEIGIRSVLTRGSMSLGESEGGLPPDSVVQDIDTILADSERLIEQWHNPAPGAMQQIALAPCSPFSVTTELMQATAALADKHDVLLHTHLAETEDENQFCIDSFGKRPLDHIEDCGWLRPKTWFAHGIHFTEDEIRRLGAASVGVTHCPSSNMVLASGICPASQLEAAGVRVGLGVDGSASNDCSNLIQEVRQALMIQRLGQPASDRTLTSHLDALRWATAGGAALLHRPELGSLAVGQRADVALFALGEPRFSGADDPLAALILCGAHAAEHVMVDGVWRVRDRELVGQSLDQLQTRHRDLAQSLHALA
ncbi:MAG: 8-oxoguanine deaminase [Pseudomonadaceae bacterium]|nr:8-oxoguanine deaminase [Pseudomonadaceae bacterium]